MTDANMGQTNPLHPAQQASLSIKETLDASLDLETQLDINQMEASEDTLQAEAEGNSALAVTIRSKKIEPKQETKTDKAKHAKLSVLIRKEDADDMADQFSRREGNREYHINPMSLSQLVAEELGAGINENSDTDVVIALVRRRMGEEGEAPDVAIVDKAFEFLLEATRLRINKTKGADKTRLKGIFNKIESAKNKHFEAHAVEIQVAQKIIGAVDAVVEKTGQTVKETLERYRDVVHNPPDLQALRKYYETKGYKAMTRELKGLNSYLGGNLKRTNLENPELAQLAGAARKMQALLGVFRQSKQHLSTMESYLKLNGILEVAAA